MHLLRTNKMYEKYVRFIHKGGLREECVLCTKKPIKSFRYWRIIMNDFPYNRITNIHHMIVPKRHTVEAKLTKKEREELQKLKMRYVSPNYTFIMEASHKDKSIPSHFHLHLVVIK
ncbi:MAG: DUF3605 domain-containing protein [Patescibacteria group bacterium]|nr:DUF3605 domain-containing protein [Patescibacteria group bacterium]